MGDVTTARIVLSKDHVFFGVRAGDRHWRHSPVAVPLPSQEPGLTLKDYVYEPKVDGIRAIVEVLPATPKAAVRMWSRNGNEKTAQFPDIVDAIVDVPTSSVALASPAMAFVQEEFALPRRLSARAENILDERVVEGPEEERPGQSRCARHGHHELVAQDADVLRPLGHREAVVPRKALGSGEPKPHQTPGDMILDDIADGPVPADGPDTDETTSESTETAGETEETEETEETDDTEETDEGDSGDPSTAEVTAPGTELAFRLRRAGVTLDAGGIGAEVVRRLTEAGETPPVYLSANVPGGDEHGVDEQAGAAPLGGDLRGHGAHEVGDVLGDHEHHGGRVLLAHAHGDLPGRPDPGHLVVVLGPLPQLLLRAGEQVVLRHVAVVLVDPLPVPAPLRGLRAHPDRLGPVLVGDRVLVRGHSRITPSSPWTAGGTVRAPPSPPQGVDGTSWDRPWWVPAY